jgi:pimeloyl-ACP methyl ester carboxylesterase
VRVLEQMFWRRMTPALRAQLLRSDAEALLARERAEHPSYDEALTRVTAPCLFLAGDADQPYHDRAKAVSARMPHATFVTLPGLNHMEGLCRVDLVAPSVLAFLATVP